MKKFSGLFCFLWGSLVASPAPILVDLFSITNFTGASTASGTNIAITNSSAVNFQDQSIAGNATISIDNTSQLNFIENIATTYSGQLTGSGTITKSGSRDLTITGNNSAFTGPLFVQTGTLFLDGNYGGSVTASPGATIFYGGAIAGDLNITAGTITTIGIKTLNVNGNYTQTNGAIYLARVSSSGQSTLINIAGTATITGSSLQVDTSSGVLFHHTYTILQANGGVSGVYNLIGSYPGLGIFVTYDANHVYLSFGSNFISVAQTPNERHVAAQLDSLTSFTSDEAYVLGALSSINQANELREALNLMSGEQYTNFILTALYADSRLSERIYDAYRDLINPCLTHCKGPHYWINAGGGKGFQAGSKAAAGFTVSNNGDVSVGVHSFFNEAWLLGGAIGYEADQIHSRLAGHADLNTTQGAIYSAYQTKHIYAQSELIGAISWADYKRPIKFAALNRSAKSKPQIAHGRFELEAGGSVGNCSFFAQPYIAGTAEVYHQNKIHEHEAQSLNLTIKPVTKWLASNFLGFHLNGNFKKKTEVVLDLAWQHYYGNLRVTEITRFNDFGSSFPIEGPKRGHDGALGALYISTAMSNCLRIYFKTSGQLWRGWQAYEFNGGINF
jgi:fibronectin-binding autotransporter adhesin